jgi:hypothetical protein
LCRGSAGGGRAGFASADTLGGRAGRAAGGDVCRGFFVLNGIFGAGALCDLGNELVDNLEERLDASPSASPFVVRCDAPLTTGLALILAPLAWPTRARFASDGESPFTASADARDDLRRPSTVTELGPLAAGFFHGGDMRRGSLSAAEMSFNLRFRGACWDKFSSLSFRSERSGLRGEVAGEERSESEGDGVAWSRRGEAEGVWMFGGCVLVRASRAGISSYMRGR